MNSTDRFSLSVRERGQMLDSLRKMARDTDAMFRHIDALEYALANARTILRNMTKENDGKFGSLISRWAISHESLRADARAVLPIVDEALLSLDSLIYTKEVGGGPTTGPTATAGR